MRERAVAARKRCRGFVDDLHRSVELEQLVVHYQPIWGIGTGGLDAVEALVRWRHPAFGLLQPDEFVPVAEQTGFIHELGTWVLEQACVDAATWQTPGRGITVAVNISPNQFHLGAVDEVVVGALGRSGLAPERLELEVTECVALDEPLAAIAALGRLRDLGVRTWLDDFGSGYNGLTCLEQLPVGGLKIDRGLIARLGASEASEAICSALGILAGDLGLDTIAEGIEQPHQLQMSEAVGFGRAQGYLLGAPLPRDQIETLIAAQPEMVAAAR